MTRPRRLRPDGERLLTTGEVARRMRISQQSVIRLIDSGQLRGIRLPWSSHRRVDPADAEAFARQHGLPWDPPGGPALSVEEE